MVVTLSSRANSQQQQAITITEGPLLIIAGPGAGKTFTLVERIIYLITHKNVSPQHLLVVTFTDKKAQELRTRISSRLLEIGVRFNLNEMALGTFHSVCLRWLDEHRELTRLKRNFTMMDSFEQQYFLYRRIAKYEVIANNQLLLGDTNQSAWYKSQTLLKWLNVVTEEGLDPQILVAASDPEVRVLGECYTLYQQQLEAANSIDFSTIQLETLNLLRHQPSVLERLQTRLRYLIVDEYQDTNTIQEQILLLLARGDRPNLCVVGDDDQALYRFRGATIRNILQFKEKFPPGQCQQVQLTTNYRSHPDIIDFYNRWMADQNWYEGSQKFRFEKRIVAREGDFPSMPAVLRLGGASADEWNREILAFLQMLRDRGNLTDWNQVAFLFRSVKNDRVVALAQFLETQGIRVYSPRSNQFFDREEVQLMLGALIFLFPQFPNVRQWSEDVHLSIWDYYDQTCFAQFAQALRLPENADLLKWVQQTAKRHLTLAENADYAFSGLFYQLLQFPLFSRYLDERRLQQQNVYDSRPMRNLAIFSQLIGKFESLYNVTVLNPRYLEKNLRNLFNYFLRFLKEGGIGEYEDTAEYAPSGCVSFLTIHQSKGLEFPVVIVGSLGAKPTKQYTDLDAILERRYLHRPTFEPLDNMKLYDFRRLFYTAFSRAQNLLVLTCKEKKSKDRRWTSPSAIFAPFYVALPSWRSDRFQPEKILLDYVKPVYMKQEYSFTSHLTLFENCAEQYRFFKELNFSPVRKAPILFGTLVHQTIEDIHRAVLKGEERQLSEERITYWCETNYVYLTKRERVYLTAMVQRIALEHVLRYYRRNRQDWTRVREAELDVSLVKDSYILTGSVDLIQGEGDTVEIVYFKSEKKPDVNHPQDHEKLDRYRRQLEVYAHIVEERTGHRVSRMHLYYTSEGAGNPYISFEKTPRSIAHTIATFDQVVNRIEAKDFSIHARPGEKVCRDCDMKFYCDRKNWIFRPS